MLARARRQRFPLSMRKLGLGLCRAPRDRWLLRELGRIPNAGAVSCRAGRSAAIGVPADGMRRADEVCATLARLLSVALSRLIDALTERETRILASRRRARAQARQSTAGPERSSRSPRLERSESLPPARRQTRAPFENGPRGLFRNARNTTASKAGGTFATSKLGGGKSGLGARMQSPESVELS